MMPRSKSIAGSVYDHWCSVLQGSFGQGRSKCFTSSFLYTRRFMTHKWGFQPPPVSPAGRAEPLRRPRARSTPRTHRPRPRPALRHLRPAWYENHCLAVYTVAVHKVIFCTLRCDRTINEVPLHRWAVPKENPKDYQGLKSNLVAFPSKPSPKAMTHAVRAI